MEKAGEDRGKRYAPWIAMESDKLDMGVDRFCQLKTVIRKQETSQIM